MSDGPAIAFHRWSKMFVIRDGSGGRFELPLSQAKQFIADLSAFVKGLETPITPSLVSGEEATGYQPAPDDKSIAHYPV